MIGLDMVDCIATRYGLDGPRIESLGARVFAPVQTGPRAYPASWVQWAPSLFPGGKLVGA
jgi:hypothetical protein